MTRPRRPNVMTAVLRTDEHDVTVYGATGGEDRPFHAVCSCLKTWHAREGDPWHPTLAEWGVIHQHTDEPDDAA